MVPSDGRQGENDADPLGQDRGQGRAEGAQVEGADEQHIQADIEEACNSDENHGAARVPLSAEDAGDGVIRRNEGKAEETGQQVSVRVAIGFGRCLQELQDRVGQKGQ